MEPPNIYTYRRSELPPMTDGMKSAIAAIDFTVAELILKFQGNYLALTELIEVLADSLNSAESNLCSIRIIPDAGEPELLPRAIGLTDLPTLEKQLIVSTAITSTIAIKMIASFLGCSFDQAASHVSNVGESQVGGMSSDQVEMVVTEIQKQLRERSREETFVIKL
jgi:hypothetical protein